MSPEHPNERTRYEPAGVSTEDAWEPHADPVVRPPATPPVGPPTPPTAPAWDPRLGRWGTPAETARPVFAPPPQRGRIPSPLIRAAIAGGVVGALLAAAATIGIVRLSPTATRIVERRLEPPAAIGSRDGGGSIVEIAAQARPWVVNVNVQGEQQGLFGQNVVQGTGSGVIVRSDGHIITNAHVVADATRFEVTLASGETLPAEVVGADVNTDIAVLKIDRDGLPTAVIGSVTDLEVGELAVAIGSPLGLQQSVTAGIVSALGRTVDRQGLPPLVDMIQTDAPITQGNSGGALIDGRGALVGINTAIAASPTVGAEGVAFAIPIDIAKRIADELIETGTATYPWLGIQGGNIDAETARQFGIDEGALVIEVIGGSPADDAGLRARDIVVGFDDEPIGSMNELIVEIRKHRVGDDVPIEIVRDGERLGLQVTLGDKPDDL